MWTSGGGNRGNVGNDRLIPAIVFALLLVIGAFALSAAEQQAADPGAGDVVLQNFDNDSYTVTVRASTVGETAHEVDGRILNRTTVTVPPDGMTVDGFVETTGRYDIDIEGPAGIGRHYGLYICRQSNGDLGGPTVVVKRDGGQGDAYRAPAVTGNGQFCETTPTHGPATR